MRHIGVSRQCFCKEKGEIPGKKKEKGEMCGIIFNKFAKKNLKDSAK